MVYNDHNINGRNTDMINDGATTADHTLPLAIYEKSDNNLKKQSLHLAM